MTIRLSIRWLALGAGCLLALLLAPRLALAQPPAPHQFIEAYEGPATCAACHGDVADDVAHSVHFTWEGKLDHYSPVAGTVARINWLSILNEQLEIVGGCGRCHIGDGTMPASGAASLQDKAGIDCLICHSPVYDTSLRFPVQGEDGQWQMTQDRTLLAARQAQRPTDANCLLCHQNVGVGSMTQLGREVLPAADTHGEAGLADVHVNAGMTCVDCHASDDHRMLGFGPNIWSRDLPDQRLLCDTCHTAAPHDDPLLNQHVRLDCRTCHVTATGGLVARDWTAEPEYDPVTELYSPIGDQRPANSVAPVYGWYNGAPYQPGQPWPGSRSDTTARLQPFKEFTALAPADASSGQPIPLKLDPFYMAGDLEQAIAQGVDESGMDYSGSWQPQESVALLQLSHGVVDGSGALNCQDCHRPDGVMDFASLGYTDAEVALFTSISSQAAGVRPPLELQVVIPPAQPLPTPVNLSGDVAAARGFGLRIPWHPLLVVVFVIGVVGVGVAWMRRQRPQPAQPAEETQS